MVTVGSRIHEYCSASSADLLKAIIRIVKHSYPLRYHIKHLTFKYQSSTIYKLTTLVLRLQETNVHCSHSTLSI